MTAGVFITIEGIEGAGKSTALNVIQSYLTQKGYELCVTREPGGTPLAEEIREVLLHPESSEKMFDETELLLMFAARAQHLQQVILPALAKSGWVICDRFIDATYAYQGAGRGMNHETIAQLDTLIVGNTYPQLTFLLDIDPELGLARAEKRGQLKDRIEAEKVEFFTRIRNAYLARAKAYPERIKVIDAALSLNDVHHQLYSHLDVFLASLP